MILKSSLSPNAPTQFSDFDSWWSQLSFLKQRITFTDLHCWSNGSRSSSYTTAVGIVFVFLVRRFGTHCDDGECRQPPSRIWSAQISAEPVINWFDLERAFSRARKFVANDQRSNRLSGPILWMWTQPRRYYTVESRRPLELRLAWLTCEWQISGGECRSHDRRRKSARRFFLDLFLSRNFHSALGPIRTKIVFSDGARTHFRSRAYGRGGDLF